MKKRDFWIRLFCALTICLLTGYYHPGVLQDISVYAYEHFFYTWAFLLWLFLLSFWVCNRLRDMAKLVERCI
jgi:hypothetical protein